MVHLSGYVPDLGLDKIEEVLTEILATPSLGMSERWELTTIYEDPRKKDNVLSSGRITLEVYRRSPEMIRLDYGPHGLFIEPYLLTGHGEFWVRQGSMAPEPMYVSISDDYIELVSKGSYDPDPPLPTTSLCNAPFEVRWIQSKEFGRFAIIVYRKIQQLKRVKK